MGRRRRSRSDRAAAAVRLVRWLRAALVALVSAALSELVATLLRPLTRRRRRAGDGTGRRELAGGHRPPLLIAGPIVAPTSAPAVDETGAAAGGAASIEEQPIEPEPVEEPAGEESAGEESAGEEWSSEESAGEASPAEPVPVELAMVDDSAGLEPDWVAAAVAEGLANVAGVWAEPDATTRLPDRADPPVFSAPERVPTPAQPTLPAQTTLPAQPTLPGQPPMPPPARRTSAAAGTEIETAARVADRVETAAVPQAWDPPDASTRAIDRVAGSAAAVGPSWGPPDPAARIPDTAAIDPNPGPDLNPGPDPEPPALASPAEATASTWAAPDPATRLPDLVLATQPVADAAHWPPPTVDDEPTTAPERAGRGRRLVAFAFRPVLWALFVPVRMVRGVYTRVRRVVSFVIGLIRRIVALRPADVRRWLDDRVAATTARLRRRRDRIHEVALATVRLRPRDMPRVSRVATRWSAELAWRRRRRLVVLAFVALVAAVMLRPPPPPEIPEATVARTGVLELSGPEATPAGEDFVLTVAGVEPDREVHIALDAGYGVHRFSGTPDGDTLDLTIPAFTVPASGTALVTALQGELAASTSVELEPGAPADPIDVYLGPRTVIADAAHFVMLVAIPEDAVGNPVANGTVVDYTITRPNLTEEVDQRPTEILVSWMEVFSRTVTGRTRLAAISGEAGAPERTFLEVAGIPADYGLELLDPLLPADGLALIRVRTDVLQDEFGNVMPDGTVVYLDADGATGTRRIHSQTNGGRAEFTVEVPEEPGEVVLEAIASGVISEPLTLDFDSAVLSLTAEIEVTPEVVMVHIGPVRSVRQSYIQEGVRATVTMADGTVGTADLSLGVGTAFFPADVDASSATVEVLGSEILVGPTGLLAFAAPSTSEHLNRPPGLPDEPTPDPAADPTDPADPDADPDGDPAADPDGDPAADPAVDPDGDPAVDPDADPAADPDADPDPDGDPTAAPPVDPDPPDP